MKKGYEYLLEIFAKKAASNNKFVFIAIALGLFVFFIQMSRMEALRVKLINEEKEKIRLSNNLKANEAEIQQVRNEKGDLEARVNAFDLKIEDMEGEYNELFKKYEIEKDKEPITIIETVTKIEEVVVEVFTEVLGDTLIVLEDKEQYDEFNYRNISAFFPYQIVNNKLQPSKGSFQLDQGISLNTSLERDEETKELMINITTPYPGLSFSKITGANFSENEINKKILKQERREFGIGFNVGFGLAGTSPTAFIGIGFNYTPRILQF